MPGLSLIDRLLSLIAAPFKRRLVWALDTDFERFRRAGDCDCIFFVGLWLHDRSGEGAFASSFEAEILSPTTAMSTAVKPRRHNYPKEIPLPLNVPPFGASEKIDLLVCFDRKIPEGYTGRISAIGREGVRRRWKPFTSHEESLVTA
jgi:hypothetical protein